MHRVFTDERVSASDLDELCWAAQRAQQARSGVRVVISVDDDVILDVARQVLPGFINNAPAMIVLASDLPRAADVLGQRGVHHVSRLDAGAAVAHVSLMAQALGLGVCTVTSWCDASVATLLHLPAHIRPDAVLAVGHVDRQNSPPAARGFRTSAFRNAYGVTP